jgi:hypothetical protein
VSSRVAPLLAPPLCGMGMLFLVWGAQKIFKALLEGWKAMTRCRWSWRTLRCVPPPPPPSVRAAITAALSDPCWARWVQTLHRNLIQQGSLRLNEVPLLGSLRLRWYHLVLCVTLVAMLIVHLLEKLDCRSARHDSLALSINRHRRRELRAAYLRTLALDGQAASPYRPPLPL